MAKKRKHKRENSVQSTDCPASKQQKLSPEGIKSKEMPKKTSSTKKKKKSKKTLSQPSQLSTTVTHQASGSSIAESKPEKMQTDSDNDLPKLNIDLEKLFRIGGDRANGSHLHCSDIKNLLLYTVLGPGKWDRPTWCNTSSWDKVKQTLFVMVGNVGGEEYITYKECFKNIDKHFTQGYPVKNDGSEAISLSPIGTFLHYKMKKKSAKKKFKNGDNTIMPVHLILTKEQRIVNEYPVVDEFPADRQEGYVSTKKEHTDDDETETTEDAKDESRRLFAIDCEMCETGNGGRALTRISVVNESLDVVYDSFVKPEAMITNYLTQYSGITEEMLKNVRTTLGDVQQKLLEIVSADDILVGHSLENDLQSLKLFHANAIDTSVIYGDQRGARYKPSLKRLVMEHLTREIQASESGHCSIEDARACMELVQLKLEKGKHFGLFDQPNESIFEAFSRASKTSALVDTSLIARQHCFLQTHAVLCTSDKDVVKGTKSYISKTDFVFAHLKGFESLQRDYDKRGDKPDNTKVKATLQEVDSTLGEMMDNLPTETLLVVLFSSGFLPSAVQALQRDKEQRKTELVKFSVKKARDCLCFIKVTK